MAIQAHSRKKIRPQKKPSLAGYYKWIGPLARKPHKRIKNDGDCRLDLSGEIWVNRLNSDLGKVVVKAAKTGDVTAAKALKTRVAPSTRFFSVCFINFPFIFAGF